MHYDETQVFSDLVFEVVSSSELRETLFEFFNTHGYQVDFLTLAEYAQTLEG